MASWAASIIHATGNIGAVFLISSAPKRLQRPAKCLISSDLSDTSPCPPYFAEFDEMIWDCRAGRPEGWSYFLDRRPHYLARPRGNRAPRQKLLALSGSLLPLAGSSGCAARLEAAGGRRGGRLLSAAWNQDAQAFVATGQTWRSAHYTAFATSRCVAFT